MEKHVQTQTEWEDEMAEKILAFSRSELCLDLRFLDIALLALVPKADHSLRTLATDGRCLYYSSEQMIRVFKNNPLFVNRVYLHSVLHCVYLHLWLRGEKDPVRFGLACDMAVEYTIDHLDKPGTKRILSLLRRQWYDRLRGERRGISAAVIYRILLELAEEEIVLLQQEFYTDDHRYWPADTRQLNDMSRQAKEQWNKIARQTKLQQEKQGEESGQGEELLSVQLRADRSRRSYRDFLQKFTVLHEELHCDPEEFDLSFYTYGLRFYGNLPLIEPMETREVKKIREFVIVVDTSESTSGGLVKGFLRETFHILGQRERFFEKCNIHIIQCDNQVRRDEKVGDLKELEALLERFVIVGGGGTDFRPAFAYVNELIEQKVLNNLGGLLYFTDGKGIYPKQRPAYQTAFLFLEDYDELEVPPWAMRIRLEPEEFTLHTD